MRYTKKIRKVLSDRRKLWWKNVKENDPEKYKRACENIRKNHARPALGKTGEKAPGWKGGRFSSKRDEYILVYSPNHPFAKKGGGGKSKGLYVLEHRLVMEKKLGRYLLKGEDVHHKNGDKKDNRIENLMLVSHNKHLQEHGCPNCGFTYYAH